MPLLVCHPQNILDHATVFSLFILYHKNSIKGKGLEGEFVYGWSGSNMLLIPLSSPDYKDIVEYTKIIQENKTIKVKDLVVGRAYSTKQNGEYVYMGRFDKWDREYVSDWNKGRHCYEDINKGKHHFFVKKVDYYNSDKSFLDIIAVKSLGDRFISVKSDEIAQDFAELFDMLECNTTYSPIDNSKDEYASSYLRQGYSHF